jgi:hypothetical protein
MLTCDNIAVEREHAERLEGSEVNSPGPHPFDGREIVATYACAGQLRGPTGLLGNPRFPAPVNMRAVDEGDDACFRG